MSVTTIAQRNAQRQAELREEARHRDMRAGVPLPTKPKPVNQRERATLADGRKAKKVFKGGGRKAAPISLGGPVWSRP